MDWLTGGKMARTAASAALLFDRGDLLLRFGIISKHLSMNLQRQRIGPDYGEMLSRDARRPSPGIKLRNDNLSTI